MHEHSIKALSGPSANNLHRSIRLHSQRTVAVEGMQAAHWEAVKFLTRFADECGNIVQRGKHTNTEEEVARLRERCRSQPPAQYLLIIVWLLLLHGKGLSACIVPS